jgi:hypothetical protein
MDSTRLLRVSTCACRMPDAGSGLGRGRRSPPSDRRVRALGVPLRGPPDGHIWCCGPTIPETRREHAAKVPSIAGSRALRKTLRGAIQCRASDRVGGSVFLVDSARSSELLRPRVALIS